MTGTRGGWSGLDVFLSPAKFTSMFFLGVFFVLYCLCLCLGCGGGCVAIFLLRNMPAQFAVTNRRNPGLTSVDRKTSLLSHVQYPVSYQSRLQRIYDPHEPKRRMKWCWAEAYRYA